jgi:ABC-type amino acid transport substrate-binding protein
MYNEVALQKVLFGEVDAAVVDIASLAYYTKNNALSYLTTVGQTWYDVELSFAVPKSKSRTSRHIKCWSYEYY